jgi:uncharacterized membrane protein (UPF0182 family)
MTARGRDNMRGFLVARADLDRSPRVSLFRLPSEQVLGPRQVEVRVDQDPVISQQFTLWQQRGSRVIRGHLMVVPLEGTFVYVEPVFLEAESRGAAPSLERVILATAERVAMGDDVSRALLALRASDGTRAADGVADGPRRASQLARIEQLIERADEALRAGDLAAFGRLWNEIRAQVARASEETGEGGTQ